MASESDAGGRDGGGRGVPLPRLLVAAGVALEALVLLGLAVVVAVVALRGQAADRAGALVLALTAAVLAAGVGAVAAGVGRGRPWSRSPTLVWQLLQLAVAVTGLRTLPWVAVPAAVVAVAVGAGVLLGTVVPRQA